MHISRVVRTLQQQAHLPTAHGTINPLEIAHFSRLSSQWWDEQGEFGFLHKMNPVRVQFIRQKLLEVSREERGEEALSLDSLGGLDVLDVGCGGGLLSEVRTVYLALLRSPIFIIEPCASWCPDIGD